MNQQQTNQKPAQPKTYFVRNGDGPVDLQTHDLEEARRAEKDLLESRRDATCIFDENGRVIDETYDEGSPVANLSARLPLEIPYGTRLAGGGTNHPGKPAREGQLGVFKSPYSHSSWLVDVAERDRCGTLQWVSLPFEDPRFEQATNEVRARRLTYGDPAYGERKQFEYRELTVSIWRSDDPMERPEGDPEATGPFEIGDWYFSVEEWRVQCACSIATFREARVASFKAIDVALESAAIPTADGNRWISAGQ
ncbi:hypothetical protein [Paraburkholderia sp. SIMBA_054]|uniref:hypothetical protein n=1 Tax=Paraburkholderia sp. SIMBA_054 TaxID=3085795 RepID=UPI00397AF358